MIHVCLLITQHNMSLFNIATQFELMFAVLPIDIDMEKKDATVHITELKIYPYLKLEKCISSCLKQQRQTSPRQR